MNLTGVYLACFALLAIIGSIYYELSRYRMRLIEIIFVAKQPEIRQSLNAETLTSNIRFCEKQLNELFFWIPFTWIAVSGVALLWLNFSMEVFSPVLNAIAATIIGALVMKRMTTKLYPNWLTVWHYQMLSIYNTNTSKMIINKIKAISDRVADLADKQAADLTDQELQLVADSLIELAQLNALGEATLARQKEIDEKLSALTDQ